MQYRRKKESKQLQDARLAAQAEAARLAEQQSGQMPPAAAAFQMPGQAPMAMPQQEALMQGLPVPRSMPGQMGGQMPAQMHAQMGGANSLQAAGAVMGSMQEPAARMARQGLGQMPARMAGQSSGMQREVPAQSAAEAQGRAMQAPQTGSAASAVVAQAAPQQSQTLQPAQLPPRIDPEQIVRRVIEQSRRFCRDWPGFDAGRELRNPQFARLVAGGMDVPTAYTLAHQQEFLQEAYRMGAAQAQAQFSSQVQTNRQRPMENGAAPAGVVTGLDPKSLSRSQREQIRQRVRRGERIVF